MDCCAEPLNFGELPMHPSEVLAVEFDWLPQLAKFWEGGEFYHVGDIRRPSRPNGYAFHCAQDGQSAAREPRWVDREGFAIPDGSTAWVAHRANLDGVDLIVSAIAFADAGITIGTVSWTGDEVTVPVSGPSDGVDYVMRCEIDTQSGQHLVGVLTVKARAQRAAQCA